MLWIKEVEMVDSWDELKSSRSIYGKDFPNFEMLDVKIASALNKIIQNSRFKKKVESPERGPVTERETNHLHDLWLLYSDWRSFILCYSSWWQHSGVRHEMGRSSILDDKISTRWYLGKSVQIQDTWVCATQNCFRIVRHGDSSEDIGSKLSKVENHGKEEYRSDTPFTTLWCQAWENSNWSSDKESKGIIRRCRRKRYLLPVERKMPVFARRPLQFPPRKPRSCEKTRTHCREVEVCREREVSEATVTVGPFFDNRVDIIWRRTCTRTPREYWHPPECQLNKNETDCKAGDTCLFPHYKVDEQPNKKPKKSSIPKRREKRR